MEKAWCVVHFDDGVQIVPQIWIQGDRCYWPTFKSLNSQKLYQNAVREYQDPDETWPSYSVRILGVYKSYQLAVPKLKLAEVQSDLNTDDDTYKKSRSTRKKILVSSSSDEEDDLHKEIKSFPKIPHQKQRVIPADENENPNGMDSSSAPKCNVQPLPPFANENEDHNNGMDSSSSSKCKVQPLPTNSSSSTISSGSITVQYPTDCCVCCCKFDKEYKRKTENDLREVKNQLKLVLQVLREQNRLKEPSNNCSDEMSFENFQENLPLKSMEDLEAWEKKLSSKDEQKKMVHFLARIGGNDTNTVVKNIFKKLMSDAVATKFNWEGKKGKQMFSALVLSDCIKKAVAASPNTKCSTEQDVITAIKNWLRHAAARLSNQQNKKLYHQDDAVTN